MISPVSAIEAIEKAMEGVTHAPGVWEAEGTAVYCDDKTGQRVASTQGQYLLWTEEQKRANARYIAACNPVAMREVLALARQAEALQRGNAEKDARIAEMAKVLTPFARIADMTRDKATGASVMVNVDRCRDVRALLGGENAE